MTEQDTLGQNMTEMDIAGIENPRRTAEAILAHILGVDRAYILAGRPLTPLQEKQFHHACRRRATHEPLEYILGKAEFAGITLTCDRRALIPRPETEDLVDMTAKRFQNHPSPRIADIGTGTGAIALALAARLPQAEIVATDVSKEALDLARENASRLVLGVTFRQGRDLEALDGTFDAILGNPPYVAEHELAGLMPEVRDWEAQTALVGGPEGTEVLARWIAAAPRFLKPGGWLALEMGAGQDARVRALFQSAGFGDISTTPDFAGILRFVSGSRHE